MDNIETLESKYPWVKFYRELAEKLLEYKDRERRRTLVIELTKRFGTENTPFRTKGYNNKNKEFDDIDPFSVIAYTLRTDKEDRGSVCHEYKMFFKLDAEIPSSFGGLTKTRFFSFWDTKEFSIDEEWNIYEGIMRDENPDELLNKFQVNFKTLYDVLYSITPDKYVRCNTSIVDYCNQKYNTNVENLTSYKAYRTFREEIEAIINDENTPYNNFIDFCKAADEYEVNKTTTNNNPTTMNKDVENIIKLLKSSKNIILQGAPGCGKTYITTDVAVKLCDGELPADKTSKERYKKLVEEGRIGFTTFHQSMDYEEFVEGLKPEETDDGQMKFVVKSGIFKRMCENASSKKTTNFSEAYDKFISEIIENEEPTIIYTAGGTKFGVTVNRNKNLSLYTGKGLQKNGVLTKENLQSTANGNLTDGWKPYFLGVVDYLKREYGYQEEKQKDNLPFVLIIDEINRANISKVLGELITLLESSKRLGEDDEFKVTLPYSGETFGVPSNLYIIGTMNTADRSVGYIDYAIRRRFAFYTLKANEDAITKYYEDKKGEIEDISQKKELDILSAKETKLFKAVKKIVDKNLAQDFNVDDLMVGHSYFMAKNEEEFDFNLEYKIKPLLKEYVRDGILIGENVKDSIEKLPTNSDTSEEK